MVYDVASCIYSHDTKTVGCMFFHIMHNCTRGANCRFSHEVLTEEQKEHLKNLYDELEMEKQSVNIDSTIHAVDHARGGGPSHAE